MNNAELTDHIHVLLLLTIRAALKFEMICLATNHDLVKKISIYFSF